MAPARKTASPSESFAFDPSNPPPRAAVAPAPVSPSGGRAWSAYQRAIFAFMDDPEAGNLIIDAKAGSGKTTTIEEAFRHVPRTRSSLFLAFNKSIQVELASRGVNARTFHSICFRPVLAAKGQSDVTKDKLAKLCRAMLSGTQAQLYEAFIKRLVGLARSVGIDCLIDDADARYG